MFMSTILSFPATKICQVRTKRKPLNIVNFLYRNETNFSKKECLDLFFKQNLRFGFKKKKCVYSSTDWVWNQIIVELVKNSQMSFYSSEFLMVLWYGNWNLTAVFIYIFIYQHQWIKILWHFNPKYNIVCNLILSPAISDRR